MRNHGIDTVLVNGKVLTMNGSDAVAQAVAVGNGKIFQVGDSHEIEQLAGSETKRIDLRGKTMLPGFIDAHTHSDMYGMMTSDLVVDCHIPPLESVDDILNAIREKAASIPKGELILGQGRTFQPYPTKQQLDEAAPDHPVIIKPSMHWYLLMGYPYKCGWHRMEVWRLRSKSRHRTRRRTRITREATASSGRGSPTTTHASTTWTGCAGRTGR